MNTSPYGRECKLLVEAREGKFYFVKKRNFEKSIVLFQILELSFYKVNLNTDYMYSFSRFLYDLLLQ
jgi:hypothetical protein